MKYLTTLFYFIGELAWQDQNAVVYMILMYDPDTDSIVADYGGANDDKPTITLYGILDVDNPPSSDHSDEVLSAVSEGFLPDRRRTV